MVKGDLVAALRRAPFIRAFVFYATGILLGYYRPMSVGLLGLVLHCTVGVALVLAVLEWKRKEWSRKIFPYCFYAVAVLAGLLRIGGELPQYRDNDVSRFAGGHLRGIIVDEPIYRERSVRFPFDVHGIVRQGKETAASGRIMVTIARDPQRGDDKRYYYGDELLCTNKLAEINPPYNPQQFDYRSYLAKKNIHWQMFLRPPEIQQIHAEKRWSLMHSAIQFRKKLAAKMALHLSDEDALGIMTALLLGDRVAFAPEELSLFVDTGTIHVLSVSGFHVGIVFFLLNFILRFCDRIPYGRRFRACIILLSIWSYTLVTGVSPSVLRAATMLTFLLCAKWTNRANQSVNSLFASALFLLVFDPFMLFNIGFQLSYLAVFGLFTVYPLLNKLIPCRNRWVRAAVQLTLVSLSAQLFTGPLAVLYFGQFPTYFLPANLFVTLPVTLLMYLGVLFLCSPFPWINAYIGEAIKVLSRFMLDGLQVLTDLPFAQVVGISMPKTACLALYIVIFSVLLTKYCRKAGGLWVAASAFLFFLCTWANEAIQLFRFQGFKVYNLGQEVAAVGIDRGRVTLVSSFNSLNHEQLKNKVLPDVYRYAAPKRISFYPVDRKEAGLLHAGWGKLGIIERGADLPAVEECSVVLWRNLKPEDIVLLSGRKGQIFLFDGSTKAHVLNEVIKAADALGLLYYVLKDNFAYVWTKPD